MNAGLAFFLELAMLASFGYWGFYGDKGTLAKWGLGIGLPILAAVLWGIFLAPRAKYRLGKISGNLLALFLFLLAATLLYSTQHTLLAILFATLAILNRVLILLWNQWE